MSVTSCLVFNEDLLPTSDQFNAEAKAVDDPIKITDRVDFKTHEGFLPVQVLGDEVGFEYYFGEVDAEMVPSEALGFGTHQIDAVSGSDYSEGRAATLFLKVFARLAKAAYVYPDDEIVVAPDDVETYLAAEVEAFNEEL